MLKNVLSLLLSKFYSKKESGEVAHQALPSTNGTYLFSNKSVSNWGTVSTGVAPYDGFLVLNANGDGTSDSASIFVSTPCVKSMVTFPFPSAGCSTWAPIAKGEAWAVQGSNAKQISLELCKTIGGGQALKKLILQGGGLCLNSLSSSLRRSSCRVKDRGFNTQLVRPRMQRPSALQPTVIGIRLHPAGTVTLRSQETPQALFWKSLMAVQVSLILNRLQDGILFLYRKVKNLVISFQQIQQCRICTLSLCEEKTNFAVGGASC